MADELGADELDVYAMYGYATYVCQALEEAVIQALTTMVFVPPELKETNKRDAKLATNQ